MNHHAVWRDEEEPYEEDEASYSNSDRQYSDGQYSDEGEYSELDEEDEASYSNSDQQYSDGQYSDEEGEFSDLEEPFEDEQSYRKEQYRGGKDSKGQVEEEETEKAVSTYRSRIGCDVLLLALFAAIIGIIVWLISSRKENVDSEISPSAKGPATLPGFPPTLPPGSGPGPLSFMRCEDETENCCNGLDNICDLGVDEIFYAGVHNAMASVEDGFFYGSNQQYELEGALEAGYRGINLDVCNCNGDYQLCHGICDFGARDPAQTFGSINTFLNANPTETILIILEIDNSADDTVDLDELYNILSRVDGLVEKIYVHNDRTAPWPSLRTVVDRNTRLLLFHYNSGVDCKNDNCPAGFNEWFDYAGETEYKFFSVEAIQAGEFSCKVTRGSNKSPFLAVNSFVTPPSQSVAETVNSLEFARTRLERCSSLNDSADVNIIFADFWSKGELPQLAQEHNVALGSPPPGSPTSSPTAPFAFMQCNKESQHCCNGLDSICHLRVDEILYVSVHNAVATLEGPNDQFQLERALEAGYRGLNFEVCSCQGEYQLCTGMCGFGVRDPVEIFESINRFMDNYPTETILITLDLNSDVGRPIDLAVIASILSGVEGLMEKIYVHEAANCPWPTLREVVDANTRLLIFHYNGVDFESDNYPPGFHSWPQNAGETRKTFRSLADLQTSTSCEVTQGSNNHTFFAVNTFISPPSHLGSEKLNALSFARTRLAHCSSLNDFADVNVIFADFWLEGELPQLAQEHNAALASRRNGMIMDKTVCNITSDGGASSSPTFAPTQLPTFAPTQTPTFAPTQPPTFAPIQPPTFPPTQLNTNGGVVHNNTVPPSYTSSSPPTIRNITDDETDKTTFPDESASGSPTSSPSLISDKFIFMQCEDVTQNCCNGLDSICNLRVDEIFYASVHNAMASVEGGFLFQHNHQFQLEGAMEAGYRGINLDVCNCNGQYQLCHGTCDLGARDPVETFASINSFLDNNPTETILIILEIDDSADETVDLNEFYSILSGVEGLLAKLYVHEETAARWPTLRETVDANTRLLLFHYNAGVECRNNDCPRGFHYWFDYAAETEYSFASVEEILATSTSCEVTLGSNKSPFLAINSFVTPPSQLAAETLNSLEFARARLETCSSLNDSADVNLMFADFWSVGELPQLAQEHNSVLISRRRQPTPG